MLQSGLVSVSVFAYNEARCIKDSLDAICASASLVKDNVLIHVMINGCSDNTESIVQEYAAKKHNVRPVVLRRGDKANAWNHYTHHVAPDDAAIHVFTDGDMVVNKDAIAGFIARLAAVPEANGCAGLPRGGRSEQALRKKLIANHEMAGNLYAVRGTCLMAFRQHGVRLPFGMFGEDGLVATLIKCDLDTLKPLNQARIIACETALFGYEPLSPWSARDWLIYRNRRMRYAVRRQQARMLYPLLFDKGTGAMPDHVADLYKQRHRVMKGGWNGLDTVFDWIARRRIMRDIAADETIKAEERAHLYS